MVGGMSSETFSTRLKSRGGEAIVVFVGDREDVQLVAIQNHVIAIVVTGGLGVSVRVRAAAKEAGGCLIFSPVETATAVMSGRGAVRVEQIIDQNFNSFHPEVPFRPARQTAPKAPTFLFLD